MRIKLDEGARMPVKAHRSDAGYDLFCREECYLKAGGSVCIDTGVHMEIPEGWYGKIESKSGLNVKHSIVSCGGVIDSGYTGSIVVKLYNFNRGWDYIFRAGDKVAQIVFMQCGDFELEQVDALGDTERGSGGFGSTGR